MQSKDGIGSLRVETTDRPGFYQQEAFLVSINQAIEQGQRATTFRRGEGFHPFRMLEVDRRLWDDLPALRCDLDDLVLLIGKIQIDVAILMTDTHENIPFLNGSKMNLGDKSI